MAGLLSLAALLSAFQASAGDHFLSQEQFAALALLRLPPRLPPTPPRQDLSPWLPVDDDSPYLNRDRTKLTSAAATLLKSHFSRTELWTPYQEAFAKLEGMEGLRLVLFGEDHGVYGNSVIVSAAMEALKDKGYTVIFVELGRHLQERLDLFLKGPEYPGELYEMPPVIREHPGFMVLRTAGRLGLKVIAMDAPKSQDRDQAMFQRISDYLKANPGARGIVFGGVGHMAYRKNARQGLKRLGALLRADYAGAMKIFRILPDYGSRDMTTIRNAVGSDLPTGSVIASAGSPIDEVPHFWVPIKEGGANIYPYSDWDYLITQPAP